MNSIHCNSACDIELYRWMYTARCIDAMEHQLVNRGEAFFHASGAGHESVAALAAWLQKDDFLHCHYRDKALLLARGVSIEEFFNTLLCNSAGSSAGRQLSPMLSAPTLNILPMVGPVGNNALQSVGIAAQIRDHEARPLVVCSLGDGGTQQGEFLEAVAEAIRWTLPVLFLVEDNRYAISTKTVGRTFFSLPSEEASHFMGLPILRLDGRDALACSTGFGTLIEKIRSTRGPALCVISMERLSDHTNADDESVYRNQVERDQARRTGDPLNKLRAALLASGITEATVQTVEQDATEAVKTATETALRNPPPAPLRHADQLSTDRSTEAGQKPEFHGSGGTLTMTEALRETLHARMKIDSLITLYGQDIEDPKGDVFGVTRGLSSSFPGRVRNSPLSEATIVGTGIGRALAGGHPVVFIQFADFIPLAFNQLATELTTLSWRSNGGWNAPLIILAACGAYRPGLGPFHAQTHESLLAHLPGIDIGMPSTAADAAGMLNTAFDSQQPTIILYPKALLNDRSQGTSADVDRQLIARGRTRCVRPGNDITLVGWGNTLPLCTKVAEALASAGASAEVIDLRWLTPFDREAICTSVRKTGKLLVAHEDNLTAGFGAEVLASVAERMTMPVQYRRLTRPDAPVPCNFGSQIDLLPSFESLLESAAEMLELDLEWEKPAVTDGTHEVVTAIGSSPADQQVSVLELLVNVGDPVKTGQPLAILEADKALVDLVAPVDGIVEALHLQHGETANVDAPLLTLKVPRARIRQTTRAICGTPHLAKRAAAPSMSTNASRNIPSPVVILKGLGTAQGRAILHNRELLPRFPAFGKTGEDGILERTGIESRIVADTGQNAVNMAAEAARLALAEAKIDTGDIDLIICSTSTPVTVVPSTACLVMQQLDPTVQAPAYDLMAACCGYLYALSAAWDFVQTRPQANVLILTTELMRRVTDINDPDTSCIFGDAATATVVGTGIDKHGLAQLGRPSTWAKGEDGSLLSVPPMKTGATVHIEGRKVFSEAVHRMSQALTSACDEAKIAVADLDLVVPHQANGRIIEAMRKRLKLPPGKVWNEIQHYGNTSSSSIPLALDTVLRQPWGSPETGGRIGLSAFGGGLTWAAAILTIPSINACR